MEPYFKKITRGTYTVDGGRFSIEQIGTYWYVFYFRNFPYKNTPRYRCAKLKTLKECKALVLEWYRNPIPQHITKKEVDNAVSNIHTKELPKS